MFHVSPRPPQFKKIPPFASPALLAELLAYREWFSTHRPHQGLQGRTPEERYRHVRRKDSYQRFEPRAQWPPGSPCAAPKAAVRGGCGAMEKYSRWK